ncbi:MAG: class I SAM-dependent methyltransferase [Spirochaetales bacterium]|nr:class I SAM-dependent methyltransferase [Spirochaetales bacterium]
MPNEVKTYSSSPGTETSYPIECDVCGSDNTSPFLTGERFEYVKCRKCGLVYQNPQPSLDDLRKRYARDYFEYEFDNERNFFNLMKLGLKDSGYDQSPGNLPGEGRFLDIGCATGMLLEYMRDKGWSVQGVDLCRESAEYGMEKRKVPIHIGTLESAAFPGNYFSLIHFSHLIEHVPRPSAFLREVKRILIPSGTAIITTPNVDGFQARLFREKWRSAIPDHLYLFSQSTLGRLLLREGFVIEKTVTWGGMAKGTAPSFIKRPMDYLAKKIGFGDVMLFKVHKST